MVRKALRGGRSAARSIVSMVTAAAATPAPTAKTEGRSPFVRLHELLADIKPGKSAINLSVGEPQHAIPPFVGSGAGGASQRFRALSGEQGHRGLSPRRRRLAWPALQAHPAARPGNRDHRAQRHARGPVPRRHRGQALRRQARRQARHPDPESVLRRLFGGRRRRRLRAGLSADHAGDRLSARPRRHRRRPAGAHRRFSISRRRPTRRARWPMSPILRASPRWRAASASWCSRTNATAKSISTASRRTACSRSRRPTSPMSWCSIRCPSVPTCRGCASDSPPATAASSTRYVELRNIAAPQVPVPLQEVAIAAYGDEAHVDMNRELYVAKFDLADQIIGDRYGYRRPEGGFFLWLDVSAKGSDEAVTMQAVARRRAARHSRTLSGARRRRRPQPRHRLHPRRARA